MLTVPGPCGKTLPVETSDLLPITTVASSSSLDGQPNTVLLSAVIPTIISYALDVLLLPSS